jgi:hypothetical protein
MQGPYFAVYFELLMTLAQTPSPLLNQATLPTSNPSATTYHGVTVANADFSWASASPSVK